MKALTGTRPSGVLQGRGWGVTAYLGLPCMRTCTLCVGVPAAAPGLPAAAPGLPAAAHPWQLHKGVAVASHEGQFHKSLPAVTTALAVSLGASLPAAALRLPAAAPGMPAAAHLWQIHNGVAVVAPPGQFPKNVPAVTTAVAVALGVSLPAAAPTP